MSDILERLRLYSDPRVQEAIIQIEALRTDIKEVQALVWFLFAELEQAPRSE